MGLTDANLIAAQIQHMPFGNVSVCAAADWEISTLKKLGPLASKDPVVLTERSFDSGFGRVMEEQRLCVRTESEGGTSAT